MADDYTDDEVREAFQQGAGILPPFYDKGYEYELQKRGDAFDRWLAEHDARLIESLADDRGVDASEDHDDDEWWMGYRQAQREIIHWLTKRARQVREARP